MAIIKGKKEYRMFQKGDKLTRTQAMRAHCFQCNGEDESNVDCQGTLCPLYHFFYYRPK